MINPLVVMAVKNLSRFLDGDYFDNQVKRNTSPCENALAEV